MVAASEETTLTVKVWRKLCAILKAWRSAGDIPGMLVVFIPRLTVSYMVVTVAQMARAIARLVGTFFLVVRAQSQPTHPHRHRLHAAADSRSGAPPPRRLRSLCASATSPPPAARSLARERELYSLSVAARCVHRSIAIRFRNYIGTG